MEALSRKTEKEKVAELEAMLADATLSGDVTDDSSISFASEATTPSKRHHAPPCARQDLATTSPPAWRPAEWSRSIDVGNDYHLNKSFPTAGGREDDVTALIYSSSSGTDGSGNEAKRRHQQGTMRARRHSSHGRMGAASYKDTGRTERRAELDEAARILRSELAAARSQLEQKEIVTRSLQRQLDQRGEIEEQTQARAEEDLLAALAKASGLKEELARTSQLLVDGALARQHLEQRCSVLTQDLQKSVSRTDDLEGQVSESRAELVKVSGALHARRGTDVVDAERAFGEELQRVQESAMREARALRQETGELRASLEQTKDKFRKACGERDAWRDEAELHTNEVNSLREIVSALRQYNENDTIDQLLGQISRWKRRAEELEQLQRVSSPEGPSCFGSVSDTETSSSRGVPMERSFPVAEPAETEAALRRAADPATMPLMPRSEGQGEALFEGLQDANNALRQELLEAKEKLLVLKEEVAVATLAAREHASKRMASEVRVKSLEGKAAATARAARKSLAARRAAKVKEVAQLKVTIQEEMGAELDRLRCVWEEQRQDEKSLGAEETPPCRCSGGCTPQPPGVDKPRQAGDATVSADAIVSVEEQRAGDAQLVSVCAPLTCGGSCANSTTNESSVAASTALVVEEEVEKRMAAVLAAAAAAEGGVAAWSRAFSSARQLIHEALISLCEHTTTLLGAECGSKHTLVAEMLSKGLEAAGSSGPGAHESSAVVPWVPGEVKAEASTALEVLRDGVESAVDGIRSALAGHAARMVSPAAAVSTAIQHATTASASQGEKEIEVVEGRESVEFGSQAEKELGIVQVREGVDFGLVLCCARQCSVGVQVGEPDERSAERAVGAGGADAAPAWEGGRSGRGSSPRKRDHDRERRRQLADDAMVEELKRKAGVLSEALQRAEIEKEDLKRSLTQRFERDQATELERQHAGYELEVSELYAYTMAIVQDFGNSSAA